MLSLKSCGVSVCNDFQRIYSPTRARVTISVAVMDASGKLVMESILETKAATLLQFLAGLRGNLSVTFEEGTWAAWLYDVLKPHVTHLVVQPPSYGGSSK